jgi:anti-anti-sigma factor
MEITTLKRESRQELQLHGRLDANWADRVGQAIEMAIQSGHHQVDLEFTRVDYVSSAGIRVLIKYHKQLKAVRGALRVVRPTAGVLEVLQLSGIAAMLVAKPESGELSKPAAAPALPAPAQPRLWEQDGVEFEMHALGPEAELAACLHGQPEAFAAGQLAAGSSHCLHCGPDLVAVGLGAFGRTPEEGKGRHGESLAVAGAAVSMPTDGSSVPDYQVTEGQLIPEMQLLYGLSARGAFPHLLRFEAGRSPRGVISLSTLIGRAFEAIPVAAAAFVIVAETSALVGSTLLRSPDHAAGQSPLAFPGVRDWMSFTTERATERQVALIVGFADKSPSTASVPFLRRIGPGTPVQGHFHAAVFPYRPLPKGQLNLAETVPLLLSTGTASTVMHLLADEREFEGVGETDFMRGACWYGALRSFGPAPQNQTMS